MTALVLALPSKGRLQEQTLDAFSAAGLAVQRDGARGYSAQMPALPRIDVRLLSASEIARALRDGDAHIGVTGEDLLREMGDGFDHVALLHPLGFGRADVVVATPAAWLDVTRVADLEEVAAAMRAQTGRRLRVATKFTVLTRQFFQAHGFDDYRIVESLGATEGAPASGVADVIVDITTTGATLKANHLRVLDDGVILRSQAQLAASRRAAWSAQTLDDLSALVGVLHARAAAAAEPSLAARGLSQAAADAALAGTGFVADGVLRWRGPAISAPAAAMALRRAGADAVTLEAQTHVFGEDPAALVAFRASLTAFAGV